MSDEQISNVPEAGAINPKRVWRRYLVALSLIGVFLALSHTASVMALSASHSDASTINESGRQRMLSQRILYLADRQVEDPSDATREALVTTTSRFTASHETLQAAARKAPELVNAYFAQTDGKSLDSLAKAYQDDAMIVADGAPAEQAAALQRLAALGDGRLLDDLETAVGAHEAIAQSNSTRLKAFETASLAAAAALLLFEALFIFWPTHRQTRDAIAQLEDANATKDAAIHRLTDFTNVAGDLFWEADTNGLFTYVGGRLAPSLSFEPDAFIGQYYLDVLGFSPSHNEAMQQAFREARPYEGILADFMDHKGRHYKLELSAMPSVNGDGKITGYMGVGMDVTERVAEQEKIRSLAERDALTGLSNRHAFNPRITKQLAICLASGKSLCVLSIDFDGFKSVNDTFGHEAGDALLKQAASRIETTLGAKGWAARLGGDEFIVVCKGTISDAALEALATQLNDALAAPYTVGPETLRVGASIGIAVAPRDARTVNSLLTCVDIALSHAKAAGQGGFCLYALKLETDSETQKKLELRLRNALAEDGLSLAFQPIIDLETSEPTGYEALARWEDPEFGTIPPRRFVHIAESTGLISVLGKQVLLKACKAAASWPATASGRLSRVSVNIATDQIKDPGFAGLVESILAGTGLAPTRLELEITNSPTLEQSKVAIEQLQALKHIGVQLSIDDFGTAQSSLAQLRLLPLSRLKIDHSIIRDMARDRGSMKIIQGIIQLAGQLGFSVLAEGVETERQAELLRAAGCQEAQGHYFSESLGESELKRQLSAPQAAPAEGRMAG